MARPGPKENVHDIGILVSRYQHGTNTVGVGDKARLKQAFQGQSYVVLSRPARRHQSAPGISHTTSRLHPAQEPFTDARHASQ